MARRKNKRSEGKPAPGRVPRIEFTEKLLEPSLAEEFSRMRFTPEQEKAWQEWDRIIGGYCRKHGLYARSVSSFSELLLEIKRLGLAHLAHMEENGSRDSEEAAQKLAERIEEIRKNWPVKP